MAPSADGAGTCGSAAGPAPHFLFLRRRENGPLGGPKEKNWSRRDRCGADLHARAGCARHGQNHDRIPPQADTSGLLSGWQTHGICFSFRCCSPYLTVVRSEAERAGPEACQIRRPPPKAAPIPPNAGKHFSVPQGYSAPGTGPQVCTAPATTTKRFAVNLTQVYQVEPLSAFSFGP